MNLLVIEDDAKAAQSLQDGLNSEGFAVDTCLNGTNGLELALTGQYDLLILDVMLPGLDGWDVLKEIRKQANAIPVVMLTARDSIEHRVRGLSLGADDYLIKPFAFAELLARVRAVLRRKTETTPGMLKFADLVIDQRRHKVSRGTAPIELSRKETQLLELLLAHQGEALSRAYIAESVWEMGIDGNSNVVDVNIRRLRAKMDDPFERKLVHTIRGRGYVLR
jgi:two-component system copper resistance phosphate regulon response regulator CusR